jgi:hypothetical protein
MPYILNKTNGVQLLVVDDSSVDNSTSLTFLGKNYSGYGEIINENFLKLLENFSNNTSPNSSISGQIWFNTSAADKKLNVFDGKKYKSIANLHVNTLAPVEPTVGDLWWDSNNNQLKVYSGNSFLIVGPQGTARSEWLYSEETNSTTSLAVPIIKGSILTNSIVTVSAESFIPVVDSELNNDFLQVKKGITLTGTNSSGSSKENGYYFWGTSSDSLKSSTSSNVTVSVDSTNASFYVSFSGVSSGESPLKTSENFTYNPSTNVLTAGNFSGVTSSSRYADLAERYESDCPYDVGTVVVIGGEKEITVTHTRADMSIIGVISEFPGFMMNKDAGTDQTHPYVALKGRVKCKVIGTVKKGNLLVSSSYPGYAEAFKQGDHSSAVIGKSLENFEGPKGIIEIVI